jgi:hypothetical protein
MEGACGMYQKRKCLKGSVWKPKGKRQLGRPRDRREVKTEMNFKEIEMD